MNPLRLALEHIRSRTIIAVCVLLDWNSKQIIGKAPFESRRERLGFWIEIQLHRLFTWLYEGSQEELDDAADVPERYRSERQRAYLEGLR